MLCQAAGCLAHAPTGVRRRKPTRADGSRVSRKRQAAGRATYYQGEKEPARCPLCQESETVFFTKNLGRARMEPACGCTISRSCCYNCLYQWAVLHALERGRVVPDASTSTYPTAPLRCVSCKKVATRLLRLSSQGTVTSDVAVPYEFPSAAVRGEMARAAQQEHDQPASWLRLVRPMKPPADIAAQEADFRWHYATGVIGRLERGGLVAALVDADRCWQLAAILVAGDADLATYNAPGVGRAKPILVDRGFNACTALVDAGVSLRGGGFGATRGLAAAGFDAISTCCAWHDAADRAEAISWVMCRLVAVNAAHKRLDGKKIRPDESPYTFA